MAENTAAIFGPRKSNATITTTAINARSTPYSVIDLAVFAAKLKPNQLDRISGRVDGLCSFMP